MRLFFITILLILSSICFAQDIMDSDLTDEQKLVELKKLLKMNPQNADLYNNIGVIYAEQRNWPLARNAFLKAVQCDPRNGDTHKNFGQVLVYLEQYDLAIAEFEAYKRLIPTAIDAFRLIGEAHIDAGNNSEAEIAFRQGLDSFGDGFTPESARLVLLLVDLFETDGRKSDRQQILEQYVDRASQMNADVASDNIVVLTLKLILENAEVLSESGLYRNAAELYRRALTIDPSRDELLSKLAINLLDAGDIIEAKVIALRATTEHPDKAGSWRAQGKIDEKEGRIRDAAEAYIKAFDIEPKTDLAVKIGELYLSIGDTRNARLYMSQLVKDENAPVEAIYNYAISLQRDKQWEISVRSLREVVKRDPNFADAWRLLATALRKTKQYTEAAEAYKKALSFGDDVKLWFLLGWTLVKIDSAEEAVEAYQKAVELDPSYSKAQYNLALVLIKLEQYEEALSTLEICRELEDSSYRVLFNMGVCCYSLENYDRAVELYDMALEKKETSAAWNNIGLAYLALEDKKEAKKCFDKAKGIEK